MRLSVALLLVSLACDAAPVGPASAVPPRPETLRVRGRSQTLQVYGQRGADPVIVLSGDGGWIHLGPHVAELLSARGAFVAGFDVRAYLAGFTTAAGSLTARDVPGDIATIVAWAAAVSARRPVLVGVSEGAGLAVLAAADPALQRQVAGVVSLGLPEVNELAWRWKDAWIYLTHGVPNEPVFDVGPELAHLSPVPFAAIYSSHDEFVPMAVADALFARASESKRRWIVEAANHRFSDNLAEFDARLLDALAWTRARSMP